MYRKNTASQFVCFQMLLTATGAVATGLSPAARRCIDGTFAAGGGTVTEDSAGFYKYAMSQADTNGNDISLMFSAATAMPVCVNFVTTAADPTDAAKFGLTNLDATITSRLASASYTAPSNLTAAQIATGIWQDTTAGDFTTALSVGKSVMNGVSLGTGLTIAAVSGAVGSVTGAVGSVTGNVGGSVASVTAGVTVTTNNDKTGYTASTVSDKTGYALTSGERNSVADAMLDRDMSTGADSGSTTVRTPRQALRFLRNKWSIAAGTLTVTKEDDATASWTSAITTTAGDPVSTSDPAGP